MKSKKKTRASLSNRNDETAQDTGGGGGEEEKTKKKSSAAAAATSLFTTPPITTTTTVSDSTNNNNQDTTTTTKTATMWKHFEPDIDLTVVDAPNTSTSTTNTTTPMGGSRGAGPAAEEEEEIVLDFKTMDSTNPNDGEEDEILVVVMEPAVETVQEDIEAAASAVASPGISPDLEASEQDKDDGSAIGADSTPIRRDGKKQQDNSISTATTLQKTPIPPAFFCPITKQLFLEPVVAPDGITYEKHVLLRSSTTTTTSSSSSGLPASQLYPNRALQRIMEDYMELTEETWEAGIRRHIQQGLDYLWSHSAVLWGSSERPLPDAYYCPITFDLFHTPVIDPEGYTYEQAAIVPWIHTNGTSPLSRTHLSLHQLYPNHTLRALLEYQAKQTPTPSALDKWKMEDDARIMSASSGRETHDHNTTMITSNETSSSSTTNNNGQSSFEAYQLQLQLSRPPTLPQPLPPSQYPTTFEELELYRQEHARIRLLAGACTVLGVLCFVTALVLGVMFGGYCIFVSIWMGCCVRDSIRRWRILRWEQEQDEERTVHRLQEQEDRLQELRVRLQELRNNTTTNGGGGGDHETSHFQITPNTTPQQLLERVAAEEQAQRLRLHEERLAELGIIHMSSSTSPSSSPSRREDDPSNDVEQGNGGNQQ